MNLKVVLLFLLTIVIITGAPTSLAKKQYLTSLNTVYGDGSCATCHVNASSDGPRNSYGKLFENQPDHAVNSSAALRAIGAPPSTTPTLMPTAAQTFEVTTTMTPTPAVTEVAPAGAPKSPGFVIVLSLIGLFVWFLITKRNDK